MAWWPPLLGLGLFFLLYRYHWPHEWPQIAQAVLGIGLYATPPLLWEILCHTRDSRPHVRKRYGKTDWLRVGVKQIGLTVALALIGFGYWLFPVYTDTFYGPYFEVILHAIPWVVPLMPIYIWWTDRRMAEPKDGLYQWGALCLGQMHHVHWPSLANFWRGWLVKAYFLPMMFIFLLGHFQGVRTPPADGADIFTWYHWLLSFLFLVDVLGGCAGYMLTFKAADTHIRTAEPTMLGWVAAVICYNPFWGLFGSQYFAYSHGFGWERWLRDAPDPLIWAWAGLCLGLIFIYTWATVSFGVRFSNLTYRGLISHGPYQLSRHPAYVSKNLFWWLTALPFVTQTHDPALAIKSTILLLGVSGIYYLRAKTEERHLLRYPEYQAYYSWMDRYGIWDAPLHKLGSRISRAMRWRA